MELSLSWELARGYRSRSQQVRVVTEAWAKDNLYCPVCDSPAIKPLPVNTRAIDFSCPECPSKFQLKATHQRIGKRVQDAEYNTMIDALRMERFPHLFVLHYDSASHRVHNVLLIPKFMLSISSIIPRKPLSANARRAGWVGCSISLENVPSDGRIAVVSEGGVSPAAVVREHFRRVTPLEALPVKKRGWTLDVLNVLRHLNLTMFALDDVYRFEETLAAMHPENRHVRDKIRQQLQVLRDLGYIRFLGRGEYKWTK